MYYYYYYGLVILNNLRLWMIDHISFNVCSATLILYNNGMLCECSAQCGTELLLRINRKWLYYALIEWNITLMELKRRCASDWFFHTRKWHCLITLIISVQCPRECLHTARRSILDGVALGQGWRRWRKSYATHTYIYILYTDEV